MCIAWCKYVYICLCTCRLYIYTFCVKVITKFLMTFLCFSGFFGVCHPSHLKYWIFFIRWNTTLAVVISIVEPPCRCRTYTYKMFNYFCLKSLLNFKFIIILPEELNQPSQASTPTTKLHSTLQDLLERVGCICEFSLLRSVNLHLTTWMCMYV